MPKLAIPRTFDQVDARWLTAALSAGGNFFTGEGGAVIDVQPGDPVEGIAVTSTVLRLRLTIAPQGSGPDAAVIKLFNPKWTRGSALHEREVRFYRELADDPSLPIPRCYYADYDRTAATLSW